MHRSQGPGARTSSQTPSSQPCRRCRCRLFNADASCLGHSMGALGAEARGTPRASTHEIAQAATSPNARSRSGSIQIGQDASPFKKC
jgi:hypothetical protein